MLSGKSRVLFDKPWKAELLLLLVSALVYLIYFHYIIFNINSSMSSITNDTLKNYYTFAYQVKHGSSPLHFQGMNYPYGEHVVYTDCQPLFCWILRPLTFAHDHLVGIMHALILASFILTPLVLRRIFLRLAVRDRVAFPCALGLALLSPQFLKMNGGHFALSYTIMIPLGMLLLLRCKNAARPGPYVLLTLYNVLVFLIHPYMGFGLSLFSFFTLLTLSFFSSNSKRLIVAAITACVLPVLFFKAFMLLTDSHPSRTEEPFGLDVMVENAGTLLAPEFGPLRAVMEAITPEKTQHFEGHTYLGLANILLLLFLPFVLLLRRRSASNDKSAFALLAASSVLLLIAFGWHNTLFDLLGSRPAPLSQFRAVCRFAWFFYYGLGVYLVATISRRLVSGPLLTTGIAVYLLLSLFEAHFFFLNDRHAFWQWRNLFSKEQLTSEEKNLLSHAAGLKPQAIIPLPLFHGGSEFYDRLGAKRSMVPAMMYSFHTGLPILSMLASRTSITESAEVLSAMNTYERNRPVLEKFNEAPFLILRTADVCLPDEERAWSKSVHFLTADSVIYATIDPRVLRSPIIDSATRSIPADAWVVSDSAAGFLYVKKGEFKPFTKARTKDMERFLSLREGQFPNGRYILSLHFHYNDLNWRALACNFVLARDQKGSGEWLTDIGIRNLSGFYDGFGVFETFIDLESDKGYELLIYGSSDHPYRISDVMIRPSGLSVLTGESAINNYPR